MLNLRKPLKRVTHRSEAGTSLLLRSCGARQLCLSFSHGFTPEIDLVSVVSQPIQNGIRQSGVTDDVVPFLDRELANGDGGATVAVGMPVTRHPLHRSVHALLTHTAPILSVYRQIVCLAKDAQLWVVAAHLAKTDRSASTRDGSAGSGAVTPSSRAFQVPCESGSP